MINESTGFNTNKIYLSVQDYINLFNNLSKIIYYTLNIESYVAKYHKMPDHLRRINCTNMIDNDTVLQSKEVKSMLNKSYHCTIEYNRMYRFYVNKDLLISLVFCTPTKQAEKHTNYIHPTTYLKKPIFSDDFDHIYIMVDRRFISSSDISFIKDINKFNDEEEIYSPDKSNKNMYPILNHADYFNKILDKITDLICRNNNDYVSDNIKMINTVLSYIVFNDKIRFKGDMKKKIGAAIDKTLQETLDRNTDYISICYPTTFRNIIAEELEI